MDITATLYTIVLPALYRMIRYILSAHLIALSIIYLDPDVLGHGNEAYATQFNLLPPEVYGLIFLVAALLLMISDRNLLPVSYSLAAAAWFGLAISFLVSFAWTAVVTYISLGLITIVYGRIEYQRYYRQS